jgi:hypothetical protein
MECGQEANALMVEYVVEGEMGIVVYSSVAVEVARVYLMKACAD